jgi:hypothetical protein
MERVPHLKIARENHGAGSGAAGTMVYGSAAIHGDKDRDYEETGSGIRTCLEEGGSAEGSVDLVAFKMANSTRQLVEIVGWDN